MKKNNPKNDNLAVLILAGKVNLPNYNFKSHEYLFNIGNCLALEKILKNLNCDAETIIYLAVSKLNSEFKKFLPFKKVTFIEVGNTETILDSIYKSLEKILEKKISIIPITTIPELPNAKTNSCYFGSTKIPKENWSSISKIDSENYEFYFKKDSKSYGVFSYPCTGRLIAEKHHLEKSINEIELNKKSDILSLAKILIKKFNYNIVFEKWLDIGHDATYIDTKLTAMTSRFFNNITYLKENNTILKSSTDLQKISGEYFFYKNLSNKLRKFFPHLYYESKFSENIKKIEMEFVPYPNLAEIYLFKNIGPNSWNRIIESIEKIYNSFYIDEKYKIESDASWLYSSKLLNRFKMTTNFIKNSKNTYLNQILSDGMYVNNIFHTGNLYKTFDSLMKFLKGYEKNLKQYIGHGDLCFNNILVDQISGCIKLIDPKAYWDKKRNLFGLVDPNYDLAKLNHSYRYLYDSVVNKLYSINIDKNNVELSIYAPSEYDLVNSLFDQIIINKNIDDDLLRYLTASLFISMLPLHKEDQDRFLCLAILGSIVFNKIDIRKFIVKI
ncbi:hypothetical protein CUB78_06570 [Prochlorococcus marinus str. XMU1401]|uniref:Capsular biosynthesis protein n=1 Tax=Prochlorococcus marinus str. XMU1401 TaxID=2052594 RepID=A0A8I2BKG9_PROMR|nr:hypothetical protein [Prochlorococcus marinus]MBO8223266.1 hypothetical protein [Prochlorococcus marinus str. XMU1401]MBW3059798.1 hypothetical protein [Prochlorococcus marinus str. XMU1401E]MCQ9198976.1 hypothetical protein [Prochlorococcus marinus XMU1429]PJC83613.1 hypothetical protein CUB78_06570 [Prochlorococcus marinus str. XMU1401]